MLVATFERLSAFLASPDLRLGRVVIDEVHVLSDESRGPMFSASARQSQWQSAPIVAVVITENAPLRRRNMPIDGE